MGIVLFGGEKGGTGKTTLAINTAAMLAREGKDVLLLDTDRQGTASFWAVVREESETEPRISCVQKFGKGLAAQVRDLAGRYDEIIIDAGGRDSMELRYGLGVCSSKVKTSVTPPLSRRPSGIASPIEQRPGTACPWWNGNRIRRLLPR